MKKLTVVILLLAIVVISCKKEESPERYNSSKDEKNEVNGTSDMEYTFDDANDVESAIRAGVLGEEIAERARKYEDLYCVEIMDAGIPYKVFTFADYQAGYTVLAYEGKLVLLCAGFGGGPARDFTIVNENGKQVMMYKFDVGSGVSYELSGRYILGEDKANRPTLDETKSPK